MVPMGQLVALQRSAAMLTSGQSIPVGRDELLELCEELIDARQLLTRLGADLRAVATRSRDAAAPKG